jgi:hypothetical protein
MRSKIDELEHILHETDIDIICISESWLNDTITDADVAVQGYHITRKDRSGRMGGGVAIYAKDTLKVKPRPDLMVHDDLEIVWLQVYGEHPNSNILISSCYRPPSATPEYFDKLLDNIEYVSKDGDDFILLGDLNINYQENTNNAIYTLEQLFALKQLIIEPTRVTPHSSSIIDLILTSNPDIHFTSGVHKSTLSDHFLIFTCIDNVLKPKVHNEVLYRNYKTFNKEECITDFQKEYDHIFEQFKNFSIHSNNAEFVINYCWDIWKSKFIELSNPKHAPFRKSRLKQRKNP